MNGVQQNFITVDRICDFIPFVSTVNNSLDLITKIVLRISEHLFPNFYQQVIQSPSDKTHR